ncbi:MAG: hypothetical protein OXN44_08400 [Acidimicrobiaceae bacterium]|nr:hypothetical protein [Acidimicrobiaceae bacterium]
MIVAARSGATAIGDPSMGPADWVYSRRRLIDLYRREAMCRVFLVAGGSPRSQAGAPALAFLAAMPGLASAADGAVGLETLLGIRVSAQVGRLGQDAGGKLRNWELRAIPNSCWHPGKADPNGPPPQLAP